MEDRVLYFQVESESEGLRLDKWLVQVLQDEEMDISRSQIQEWIKHDCISETTRKSRVKASDPVETGHIYQIKLPEPEPVELQPDPVSIQIVYEDEHLVVVDKQRGLVVHPAAGHPRGTLVNGLLYLGVRLSALGGTARPGVVHRIDKDTSGLLVLAKSDLAYHKLSLQLQAHSMLRSYAAIAHGVLPHQEGTIDAPIGRDPKQRQRLAVVAGGKPAITHFFVKERFEQYTFLDCRLETGRTHQIRVHMAYIGHPLAGDPLYGPRHTLPIDGQALHAKELGFIHPASGEHMRFESPLPSDMERLLMELRLGLQT
ncbi:RluA family pseudouridine synthase [Alicyclobacillus sp. TC]|uniref:RluA family pseudouridine synthase n=1 Tax=Alicyclobacillus sp. TC TaxID=2606450 RepID=UPI0019324609|nr:RluA family pseudouridine synthase [Alicyclobacillus sp. TC]QRF23795.1 RluA family pseudouridine synthase [Alicyclobacillus sp. TC]